MLTAKNGVRIVVYLIDIKGNCMFLQNIDNKQSKSLKSPASNSVPVQVRPEAPFNFSVYCQLIVSRYH
jgi:hypothetical protein